MSTKQTTTQSPAGRCQLCVVPTSPALVAELSPADAASSEIRDQVRQLLRERIETTQPDAYPVNEIVLVGSQAEGWRTEHRGSLRAWGATDVQLADGYYLAEIVLRYLCADFESLITASYASLDELHSHPVQPGTLVLLGIDGSAGLGPRAPLAELPDAPQADRWARWLLGACTELADAAAKPDYQLPGEQLPGEEGSKHAQPLLPAQPSHQQLHDAGIWEPELWLELAELNARGALTDMDLLHADTSHGVARYIATGNMALDSATSTEADVMKSVSERKKL